MGSVGVEGARDLPQLRLHHGQGPQRDPAGNRWRPVFNPLFPWLGGKVGDEQTAYPLPDFLSICAVIGGHRRQNLAFGNVLTA